MGGRPSEFGEAAKPPSFFGLPEPFAVRFEKRNLVPVPGPRRAAAVAVIRHRKPTPPPRTQAPAAVDGIRARRACVEARGSGARAASSRAWNRAGAALRRLRSTSDRSGAEPRGSLSSGAFPIMRSTGLRAAVASTRTATRVVGVGGTVPQSGSPRVGVRVPWGGAAELGIDVQRVAARSVAFGTRVIDFRPEVRCHWRVPNPT